MDIGQIIESKKTIDVSLSDSWIRRFVTYELDHRLLVTKLTTPANKITSFTQHKPIKTSTYNNQALTNKKVNFEFSNKLQVVVSKILFKIQRN